ncbi:hypothetical protein DW03F1_22350 [Escherichia coli]
MCEEVHLNLAYRWFCRLGLEDEVPNHSTFSKNRHGRFRDSDLFRWLFNEVLRRCMAAGLVKGEGFAVDASIIKADASRQRGVAGDEVDWNDPKLSSRAVREYLEALDEEALAEALPKKISLTDPQSRWTAAPGGPAFFAYSTNYLIDTEHGVIMDVEATPAHRTAEVDSTRTMVERVEAGTVAKLAMRQPFVLFKGLTFQKLCLPGAFRPGDHHNKMLRPGLCVVHASPQYL